MASSNEVRLLALSDEGKENLEAVSKLLTDQTIKCTWINSSDALAISKFEEDIVYVIDPTEGKELDHLVKLGFTVIGPQCAITVLKHNIQLKKDLKYPVWNLTMLGTLICFSNIEPKRRKELMCKVERMGGKISGWLKGNVTHLVVKEVGSVKYFSAAHVNIPIMVIDWIEHLWKHGQSRYISAKDGKWEEFKCPIFLGCSVCVTGFGTNERNRIQKLITKFGGTYSGAMKVEVTTHLVVHKPEGQKYAMADKFGVKTVNVKWVYDSVEKGSCQDHNKYPVEHPSETSEDTIMKPPSSTPEDGGPRSRIPSIQDMSGISVTTVNESASTSVMDISRLSTLNNSNASIAKEDLWNFATHQRYDPVLDGMCVVVVGFTAKEQEKLKTILNISGVTRFNQLTSSVTHVIVGSASLISPQLLTNIQTSLQQPGRELWIVRYQWLLNCLNKSKVEPEIDYWVNDVAPLPEEQERTMKDGPSDDDNPATKPRSTRLTSFNQNNRADHDVTAQSELSHMQDVLTQYMPAGDDVDHDHVTGGEGDTTLLKNFDVQGLDAERDPDQVPAFNADADEQSQDEAERWAIYRGKNFLVCGFDDDETEKCVENIEAMEGRVMPAYSKRIADYAIVPITGWPVEKTVENVVTDFWIEYCMTEGRLVEPESHPMCTPFDVSEDVQPLRECVLCLSKYQEPERSHLVALITELGGLYQDNVARKDLPSDGLRKTTHLVVLAPEGDKYVGCKKWGIPTITAEWIYECAGKGRKLSEEEFSVDAPKAILHRTAEAIDETTSSGVQTKQPTKDLDFPPMPRPPSVVDPIRRRLEARAEARRAKTQRKETPLREKFLRMNVETPSKYMSKGSNPHISFDLDQVFALLKTPVRDQQEMKEAIKSNPETPMSEFVDRFLTDALRDNPAIGAEVISNLDKQFRKVEHNETGKENKNMSADETNLENKEATADETNLNNVCDDTTDKPSATTHEADVTPPAEHPPLHGVVLYVCKKLSKQRMELSSIVGDLGGEFRWTYDSACTHFVFEGKQNDTNREFRAARNDGKFIVSAHWMNACMESGTRADESQYPHVYNPNKSIQVVRGASPPKGRKMSLRTSSRVQQRLAKNSTSAQTNEPSSSDGNQDTSKVPSQKAVEKVDTAVEDSQKARENLRKTLETIMSSTSKIKRDLPTQRMSCSRAGNFSSPATTLARRRKTSSPANRPSSSNVDANIGNNSSEIDKPDSSQDVQVVWDHPTEREELERLMKQNNGANSTPKPSTDTSSNVQTSPDPPSVGLPFIKPKSDQSSSVQTIKPQLDTLSQIIREGRTPAFLVSSLTPEQKADYAAIIENMGGVYLDRDYFDPACTHLIVKRPARNEKYLASLSSGKWILSTSYIEACKEAESFVKEEPHEYGNPCSRWNPKNDTEALLVAAAHRWRSLLNEQKAKGEEPGAFSGWKLVMHVSDRHTPGFVRLVESGCGKVLARSLPYHGRISDVTHAIIDPAKAEQLPAAEIEALVRAGVHCCVPEYIADFLMKDPRPEPETLYLPRAKAILAEALEHEGTPSKRRRTD